MAGRLAFWSDNRGLASDHFRFAEALGHEAHEPQLEAVALAFRADLHSGVPYLGTMAGNTKVALTLFDRVAALDAPDWPPVLRAWMVGCRAEEHAALGHHLESDRDMDLAHRAIATSGVLHNPALDVASLDIVTSTAGLAGFIGACALALGRYQEAGAIFKQGLDEAASVGRLSGLADISRAQEVKSGPSPVVSRSRFSGPRYPRLSYASLNDSRSKRLGTPAAARRLRGDG